jgi:menaquinone-dependent protoporphyrinogen oxidase
MSILVAYASKHGATQGIAERIGENIREAGQDADVLPIQEVEDLSGYEGYVVGSATYLGHWMKDAVTFLRGNQELLVQRPVWLFSSGPLGTGATDAKGEDRRQAAVPKELPELEQAVHPREHQVFFGVLDPGRLSFAERSMRKLPAARAALPEGDFRDWDEIQDWAYGIAREVTQLESTS